MEKKYLTYAGILSAGILVVIFVTIILFGQLTNGGTSVSPTGSMTKEPSPVFMQQAGSCSGTSRFISFNPFPELFQNRSYTITGTTNLPPGDEILIQVLPLEYGININPKNQSISGEISGAVDTIKIVNGTGGSNRWSFDLDMSRLDHDTRNYMMIISNSKFDPNSSAILYGDTYCSQRFTMKE